MKTSHLIIVTFLLVFACTSNVFAERKTVDYKGVSITRGDTGFSGCLHCDWINNCVYIMNLNNYPVKVRYEYKLNSRDAAWQSSTIFELPARPTEEEREPFNPYETEKPGWAEEYQEHQCYPGEIKALRIVYVDILKPSPILQGLDTALNMFFQQAL